MATSSAVVQPKGSLGSGGIGKAIKKNWQLYLFVLPAFVYFVIFCYMPMYGVIIAFKDFSPAKGIMGSRWASQFGFKHFINFFGTAQAGTVIWNTLKISGYLLVAGFPIPVILALMLNEVKSTGYKKTIQNVTYAPNFISTAVIVGMIIMFFSRAGVVNKLLDMINLGPVDFLLKEKYFIHIYVWTGVWQSMGWSSIIFFAALSSVDPQLHEAATIDGATKLQRLLHINIPSILPTIVIMLIMQVGTILNISFEKIFLMQNSVNIGSSEVISTYVYKQGLQGAHYSYSAAIGLFNNVINLVLLLAVNKISAKLSDTSLW